jgi:hypothetical protein
MPYPCCSPAMPCHYGFRMCLFHLIYTVRPCLIHTCHDMPMLRPCPALTMPFFSSPRHSTAVERRPMDYLPAFGFFWLPHGVPQRLLSEAYQYSSQRSIPTTVKSGSSTLQKDDLLNYWTSSSDIPRLPRGLSRRTRHCRSRAGAWHGMYELTARHGRGTAWEWQGRGMGTACYVWLGLISFKNRNHSCNLYWIFNCLKQIIGAPLSSFIPLSMVIM